MYSQTVIVNDTLFRENFGTGASATTTFDTAYNWTTYNKSGTRTFVPADISGISFGGSRSMWSSVAAANVSGSHCWFNKGGIGVFYIYDISVFNTKQVRILFDRFGADLMQIYADTNGGTSFSILVGTSHAAGTNQSVLYNIPDGATSISLKFQVTAAANSNVRIDNIRVVVTAVRVLTCTPHPVLYPDSIDNLVNNEINITFADNPLWRSNMTAVIVNNDTLTQGVDYQIIAGNLILLPSGGNPVLTTAGVKQIMLISTGFCDAVMTQTIIPHKTYRLVTNDCQLVAGRKYLISNRKEDGIGGIMGAIRSGSNNRAEFPVTITADSISADYALQPTDTVAYEITLGGSAGAWTLYDVVNAGYLKAGSSSNNYLRTLAGIAEWDISIDADSAAVMLCNTNNYDRNILRYNNVSSLFACYGINNNQYPVYLYCETVSNVPLPAPTALSATAITPCSFVANWENPATEYQLYVRSQSDYLSGYNPKIVTDNKDTISGLNPNTTYYYVLKSICSGDISALSNEIMLKTLPAPYVNITCGTDFCDNVGGITFELHGTPPFTVIYTLQTTQTLPLNLVLPTQFYDGAPNILTWQNVNSNTYRATIKSGLSGRLRLRISEIEDGNGCVVTP
ncbi:MAG: fibronectin type III domain-containing protein [Bacteroidales bacterium]|jgi:hypothetical protein|nr:fibronectin type III domain-containing protein [Bacteroidales bacterium]